MFGGQFPLKGVDVGERLGAGGGQEGSEQHRQHIGKVYPFLADGQGMKLPQKKPGLVGLLTIKLMLQLSFDDVMLLARCNAAGVLGG